MNGVETFRELRKTNENKPVFIITAFHRDFFDHLKSAKEDGIDFEILRKPIRAKQLLMIVKGVLEGATAY